jgi:hypothetical protein
MNNTEIDENTEFGIWYIQENNAMSLNSQCFEKN